MNQEDVVDPYKSIIDGKNRRLKLTTDAPFAPTYVCQALTLSSDPAGIYESRIKDRHVPLDNPARESKTKKEKIAKQARKQAEKDRKKLRPLGRNAAASKGLWKLEKHAARFELFIPLHRLWMGYMSELLGLGVLDVSSSTSSHQGKMPSATSMHAKLVKADLNGALLTGEQQTPPKPEPMSRRSLWDRPARDRECVQAHHTKKPVKAYAIPSLVPNLSYIVDTVVPKQNSVFALAVPLYSTLSPSASDAQTLQQQQQQQQQQEQEDSEMLWTVVDRPYIEFDLYGNQFCFRSADRSNRKFKAKETVEL
ncbi:RNase P/MRP p29 subunit [Butyriboletus roseoflavus]|nr:RNase P/MRP p29 subunit [Butyriboletus roseoflavus]